MDEFLNILNTQICNLKQKRFSLSDMAYGDLSISLQTRQELLKEVEKYDFAISQLLAVKNSININIS